MPGVPAVGQSGGLPAGQQQRYVEINVGDILDVA